jgi:uncharacterized protein
MNLEHMDTFVKTLFENHPDHVRKFGFRDKYQHTKRVVNWAKKLLAFEIADNDILLCAAVFHDIGYIIEPDNHPKHSVDISVEYLSKKGFDNFFIERVSTCIINHEKKDVLHNSQTDKESILLIEADCLDESGAMSILRDTILEARSENISYNKIYKRLLERRVMTQPNDFFCVTETAKKFWIEKQKLYVSFIENLKMDLIE